jgi:hypothetical protein
MLLESGRLGVAETDQAYPVARLMLPELSLDGWRGLARRRDVLRVRNGNGYIVALGICRIQKNKLLVERAIALDLMDSRNAADALVAATEAFARERHCTAVHARLADPALQERFEAAGHERKVVLTCKPLDCPMVQRCHPETCCAGMDDTLSATKTA